MGAPSLLWVFNNSELEVARVKRDFIRFCVVGSFLREVFSSPTVSLTDLTRP